MTMRSRILLCVILTVGVAVSGLFVGGSAQADLGDGIQQPGDPGPMIIAPGRLNMRTGDVVTAQRPNLLVMRPAVIDPARRYVLQLDGPVTPNRRAELANLGVSLGEYLPSYSYIVDLAGVDINAVQRTGLVTWIGEFEDAWKIAPDIGQRQFQTPERIELADEGFVIVEISLFQGLELEPALAQINAIPDVWVEETGELDDRWLIVVTMPLNSVPLLAEIDAVQFVEEVGEAEVRRNNRTRWIVQTNIFNNTLLYSNGLRGEGQVIGILDTKIDSNHCSFVDNENPIGLSHRKIVFYAGSLGSQSHGTHVAGIAAGDAGSNTNTRGVAYLAKIAHGGIPNLSQTSILNAHNTNHNWGARIHSNSWGDGTSNNSYTSASRAIDLFMRNNEESLVVHSVANNSNPGSTISNPENAKNLLAVGASGSSGIIPSQNSHCTAKPGPTQDGRRKPEVFAPGCGANSANNNTSCSTSQSTGTSMATPAVAGLAALMRQYFTEGYYPSGSANSSDAFTPSGALVKAALINSAQQMTGTGTGSGYPNFVQGWGRVLGNFTLSFPGQARKLLVHERRNTSAQGLSTGSVIDHKFHVTSSSHVLRVTMAFTDVAGATNSSNPVVNDLDLEVISPTGTVYLGNHFVSNFSAPGGSKDPINNVEQVHISSPMVGEWTARIKGAAVNTGFQGYGLVITGAVLDGETIPVPGNDTCLSATVVSGPFPSSTPFTTLGASTAGPDEPDLCNFGGYTHVENDVWYRVTAPCTGIMTVSLCGADFDAKMAIYGAGCPTSPGTALACADKVCGAAPEISIPVNEGAVHRIRIGGFQGDTGTGTMVISCGPAPKPPPANDNCADATLVTGSSTPFTTEHATTDGPNEPGLCDFNGNTHIEKDVWFLVEAECTGQMHVSLCGADYNAKVAVYANKCPTSAGEALGCDDDSCSDGTPEVTVQVEGGESYLVRIGGVAGDTGTGTMEIFCEPDPVEPDCPADITGDGVVDIFDLLEVLAQWGPCADPLNCPADLTDDGVVDIFDLLEVLAQWGPCE